MKNAGEITGYVILVIMAVVCTAGMLAISFHPTSFGLGFGLSIVTQIGFFVGVVASTVGAEFLRTKDSISIEKTSNEDLKNSLRSHGTGSRD
jgi:hypothetical protein